MKSRVRLLAIDIDGTLLNSQWQLPPPNREALIAASDRNVHVVLVTGRRFTFARSIAEQLSIPWTLIASGGAVVKTRSGETLARRLLPRADAKAVLATACEYRHAALLIFDREGPGQIVVEQINPWHAPVDGYLERNRGYLLQIERLEDALHEEDPIQVLFAGPVEPMRTVVTLLERSPCGPRVHLARTEYPQRDFTLLDVLHPLANKGTALAALAKRWDVSPEEIMAVGDNWNDLEMLEFVGLPVLMGNSSPELKKRGWVTTGTNDEAGVAQAIERFLLKGRA